MRAIAVAGLVLAFGAPIAWGNNADILMTSIDASSSVLLEATPGRFSFTDGETGQSIADGGEDMYDGGNTISTNLGTADYSNRVIANGGAVFGDGSTYFTMKLDGVFILAAVDVTIDQFHIDGNLGADGSGAVKSSRFSVGDFEAFSKNVYDSGDPSINHLILVRGGNPTQTVADSTNDDGHYINNINGADLVLYMLYAGAGSREYSDTEIRLIAETFHNLLDLESPGHTCLNLPGGVKCFGSNELGQLGLGDLENRGDDPGEMGEQLRWVNLGSPFAVQQVVNGRSHSCALSTLGAVKCWGDNEFGQLGLGDTQMRGDTPESMGDGLLAVDLGTDQTAMALAAGDHHTCALLTGGRLKCWGRNENGQLGLGDDLNRGDVPDEMGDALPFVDLGTDVTALAVTAGAAHTCVRSSDGFVRCFGSGKNGTLGNGSTEDVGVTPEHMGDRLIPVVFESLVDQPDTFSQAPMQISAGRLHTCAAFVDGGVACWGSNRNGQLALGDTLARGDVANQPIPRADLGRHQVVREIQCGGGSCCAVTVQNTMKCWGKNNVGQLGLGDRENRGGTAATVGDGLPLVGLDPISTVHNLIVRQQHTCVELSAGHKCWGKNDSGQLGYEDTAQRGDTPASTPHLLAPLAL